MINKFGSEDKHLLCADGQVQHAIYCVGIYRYIMILSIYSDILLSGVSCPCLSGFPEPRLGGLSMEQTRERKHVASDARHKRAAETKRARKTA